MLSESPKVSVLLPVYNAGDYLERCLESVFGQTYSNIELVAIDDGSSDGSPNVLDAYAAREPDRMVVEHRANAGVAAARNRAIELSSGEYITLIDNDDYLNEDFIETLMNVAVSSGADLVCAGFRRPTADGKIVQEVVPVPATEWAPFAVEPAWAKLYRTSFVREMHLSFLPTNIGEDLYFTLPAACLSSKTEVIEYCGYNWFYNEKSVSSTVHKSSKGLEFERSLDAMHALLTERGIAANGLIVYFFVKYVAWFLLYTARGDNKETCERNLEHYAAWLDGAFAGWRGDMPGWGRPTGDSLRNRLVVRLFASCPVLFRLALLAYRALGV